MRSQRRFENNAVCCERSEAALFHTGVRKAAFDVGAWEVCYTTSRDVLEAYSSQKPQFATVRDATGSIPNFLKTSCKGAKRPSPRKRSDRGGGCGAFLFFNVELYVLVHTSEGIFTYYYTLFLCLIEYWVLIVIL